MALMTRLDVAVDVSAGEVAGVCATCSKQGPVFSVRGLGTSALPDATYCVACIRHADSTGEWVVINEAGRGLVGLPALPVGRGLDEAIARLVMGWKQKGDSDDWETPTGLRSITDTHGGREESFSPSMHAPHAEEVRARLERGGWTLTGTKREGGFLHWGFYKTPPAGSTAILHLVEQGVPDPEVVGRSALETVAAQAWLG